MTPTSEINEIIFSLPYKILLKEFIFNNIRNRDHLKRFCAFSSMNVEMISRIVLKLECFSKFI